jgi:DNA-binding MarR family transcriptional regulator
MIRNNLATHHNSNESCARQLVQVVPVLMRLIRRSVLQADPLMSVAHLRILEFLQRSPGASLSEVSAALEVTKATASSHVEKLVKRQLVKRVADPDERRRVVLTLTADGARRLAQVSSISTSMFSEMLAPLPGSNLHRIQDGLNLLEDSAKQYHDNEKNSGVEG